MTDQERLVSLLDDFGIIPTIEQSDIDGDRLIVSEESGQKRVSGYCMFYTTFDFDSNGCFVEMGAWE